MYKPDDIDRARRNIARHAWAGNLYGQIRQRASFFLDRDPQDLRAFISDQTPLLTVNCPECGCGPWHAFTLIDGGQILQCTDCKTTWAWDPRDGSEDWNVQAVLRSLRIGHVTANLISAGIAYRLEGDHRYAAGAAAVVRRFAEVFRHYRVNMVNANKWHEGNSAYYGKIHGWKRHDAWQLYQVLQSYDLIRDSGVLLPDQLETIDHDPVAYARDYLIDGFRHPHPSVPGYTGGDGRSLLLADPHIQDHGEAWWCIAACGALLKDRETLALIVGLFEDMLDPAAGIFHEDGTFYECAADYQQGLLNLVSGIPEVIRDNLEVDIIRNPKCSLLEKCYTWFLDASYPDDTIPAINDSHVGSRLRPLCAEVAGTRFRNRKALRYLTDIWGPQLNGGTEYSLFHRDPDVLDVSGAEAYGNDSLHLPGMGLMILRDDREGPDRTMAFVDYGPYVPVSHKHPDYLNIGLYAGGQILLPDNGYNWNPEWARLWERHASSHNTVLEIAEQPEGGKPLVWCITPGPRIAEAGLPDRNSRLIAMLPRPRALPLIVDVLRVSGDSEVYSWLLHARSGRLDLSGVGPLEPVPVNEPFRSGRRGEAEGEVRGVWTLADERVCGLEVIVPEMGPTEVTVCECPPEEDVIKETHLEGGTLKPGVELPYRGHLTVTRPGPDAVFVAVHNPYEGLIPPDVTVQVRSIADQSPSALLLEIESKGQRTLLLHNPGAGSVTHGPLSTDGRAVIGTFAGGELKSLCLAQGTHASYRDVAVSRETIGNAFCSRVNGAFDTTEIPGLP